jgi:hypothetical protein
MYGYVSGDTQVDTPRGKNKARIMCYEPAPGDRGCFRMPIYRISSRVF